jgi:signal transduction histidine kinase
MASAGSPSVADRTPDGPSGSPPVDFESFRREERLLIVLDVVVLAALMVLHAVFRGVVGRLSTPVAIAFAVRFAMRVTEAALLGDRGRALGPRGTWWYARLSIAAGIAFTAILSRLATGQESHYAVLMVIPVIAAAFRLSLPGLALTVATVVALTVGQVWIPVGLATPGMTLTESFEATTVSLIFLVVAAVGRLLAGELWRRQQELAGSLAALAAARDRLVREENLAAVGRLAAAIAHEVRNPVSMIASAVSTARRPDASPELRAEVFEILGQESLRLQRLTDDFLAYARQRPPQLRESSLAQAIDLVAGLVRARAGELGVTVETGVEEAPLTVDPFQLQQALLNLAMNGLEATPRGGTLSLRAAPAPRGGAVLAVENSGPALPPEVVGRLGEPFFTTKPRGTGLGVAIAQTIARAHGGEIVLAENAPGRVRFELRLPAAREAAA